MDERDLLDIISQGNTVTETIEIIDELCNMIEEDHKGFVSNLQWLRDEYCRDNDCCPQCGCSIELIGEYEEVRGEFWGMPTYETMGVFGCTNCNYIEE